MITGKQYTITASAAKLTTILGLTNPTFCKGLTIKNAKGAANILYIGGSDVTNVPANAWVELDANQSFTFYSGEGWLCSTDEVYLVGTVNAANIAFITIVS